MFHLVGITCKHNLYIVHCQVPIFLIIEEYYIFCMIITLHHLKWVHEIKEYLKNVVNLNNSTYHPFHVFSMTKEIKAYITLCVGFAFW